MTLHSVETGRKTIAQYVKNGLCWDHEDVLTRLNEVTDRLVKKAPFRLLVRKIRLCVSGNCVVMPSGISAILRHTADGLPRRIFSNAYEFLSGGPGDLNVNPQCNDDLVDLGDFPTFFEIPSHLSCKLLAFSLSDADAALTLTARGMNRFGEYIEQTENAFTIPINVWDGTEGVIAGAMADLDMTSFEVGEVLSFHKPASSAHICLYAYNADEDRLYFLAKYRRQAGLQTFRRYKLVKSKSSTCETSIVALCKVDSPVYEYDEEPMLIQSLGALRNMAQAIRSEVNGDLASALNFEANARRILEEEQQHWTTSDGASMEVTNDPYDLADINLLN